MKRLVALIVPLAAAASLAQVPKPTLVERIWNDAALKTWALPIAGVNATPAFYSEAEYYAAPVDNVRTYPVYAPDREPKGYRDWMRKQGCQPLIEPEKLKTERDVSELGLHFQRLAAVSGLIGAIGRGASRLPKGGRR